MLLEIAIVLATSSAGGVAVGTHEEGYRDGAAEAREERITDWVLIGGGASLVSSGVLIPCVPPAPFLVEKPETTIRGLDETRGPDYAIGYRKGYEQTLQSRRAIAGTVSAVVVGTVLAAGLGIVQYLRAEEGEPGALTSPSSAVLRF